MLLWLLACTGKTPETSSSDSDAATDERGADTAPDDTAVEGDSGVGGDGGAGPTDAPVLSDCEAWCYLHTVGQESYQWRVTCSVTDPQGLETVESGTVDVQESGARITQYLLACDEVGGCSTSFDESQGVLCAGASGYTFAIYVEDFNGNVSDVVTVTGEER